MRVITGKYRGRRLETLSGEATRPTTDMVKEALFSIIQFDLVGARVLDLFSGSGQLAIEALSRGAASVVLVDNSPEAIKTITKNVEAIGAEEDSKIVRSDFKSYLASHGDRFDIALLDPPYASGYIEEALPLLVGHMSPGGIIICETNTERTLPESFDRFVLRKKYRYGKIMLWNYRVAETEIK